MGLFGALMAKFAPHANIWRLFLAPALWQVTEFLRGWVLTGFPWLQFGYSQIDGYEIAPIFGVEMITLLLFSISGLLVLAILRRSFIALATAVVLLFAPLVAKNIQWFTPLEDNKMQVALVQGNIPQSMKWEASFYRNQRYLYGVISSLYW